MSGPPSEKRPGSRIRRFFRWLGIGILTLIGLAIAAGLVLAYWPDSSPPDDSNMLPDFSGNPDSNPLADFQNWLEAHPIDHDDYRFQILRDEVGWNSATADEVLKENAEALAQLHAMLATNISTWRWREGDGVASALVPGDSFKSLFAVNRLAAMQALRQAETGDVEGALASAAGIIKLARGILGAQGNTIHFVGGASLHRMGIRYLEKIAVSDGVSAAQLETLMAALDELEPQTADLQFAFRVEYLSTKRLVDELRSGDFKSFEALGAEVNQAGLVLLQRNDTLRLGLALTEPFNEAIEQGWAETEQAIQDQRQKVFELKSSFLRIYIHPNMFGRIMAGTGVAPMSHLARRIFEIRAHHRQAVAILAMRRYQLEHGSMPATLEKLVPDFLPAVPEDPFVNRPMRWKPGIQVIYALGADQKDDKGVLDRPRSYSEEGWDVGMKYWWASP